MKAGEKGDCCLIIGHPLTTLFQLSAKNYWKYSLGAPLFSSDWTNAMPSNSGTERNVS